MSAQIRRLLFVVFLAAWAAGALCYSERHQTSRVMSDMRSVANGLESYKIDYGVYPPTDQGELLPAWRLTTPIAYISESRESSQLWDDNYKHERRTRTSSYLEYFLNTGLWMVLLPQLVLLLIGAGMFFSRRRTDRLGVSVIILSLTSLVTWVTPWILDRLNNDWIAGYPLGTYIVRYPNREYKNQSKTFYYATDGSTGWIIQSIGPNQRRDLQEITTAPLKQGNSPIPELLPYIYDPTNGSTSAGDQFRLCSE